MTNKCAFVANHLLWSLTGFARVFVAQPFWAIRLLTVRIRFFITRRLGGEIKTPDNFIIESTNELVSYWSFFVERECWETEWITALIAEKAPVVIDVGANAGLFTHWVWHHKPDARFIVFEPLSKMANKIQAWTKRTHADVTLYGKAVSSQIGTAVFYSSSDNDTTASLLHDGTKARETQVPVVSLDSVVLKQPVFLLKIDVEGAECEVLTGAVRTLEQTRFLLVEAHTGESLSKIQQQLGAAWKSKQVGTSDYLFKRT